MVSTLYRFTPASACSRATSVRCFHPVPSAATSTTVSDRSITSGSSAYAAAGAAPGAGACAKDWKESEAGTRAARIQNFRAGVCMGVPGIAEAMVGVQAFCRRQIARRAREVRARAAYFMGGCRAVSLATGVLFRPEVMITISPFCALLIRADRLALASEIVTVISWLPKLLSYIGQELHQHQWS